jgi:hypothetical protein
MTTHSLLRDGSILDLADELGRVGCTEEELRSRRREEEREDVGRNLSLGKQAREELPEEYQ